MFRIYHSNDLELLKGILLQQMQQHPPLPFEREAILVQSQGMAHWLKLQLADGLGVSAQIEFPLPSNFVWQVFNKLQPDLPARSHFDKQLLVWKLMRLLPTLAGQSECSAIAHYLDHDEQGLKRYQLAQTIADVFDQYLVYRPDWLLNWELGLDDVIDANVALHPWQPHVWRALVADSEQQGHSLDHRARLLNKLEQLVAQYPERLKTLPKRLFVFGIAALPGSYWQVLQAISKVIDIHFFLLNPCRNFWGDVVNNYQRLHFLRDHPNAGALLDSGNPLLASWGRLGRDFLTLVNDTAGNGELQDFELWYSKDEKEPSLLALLQKDILDLSDGQQGAFSAAALTDSRYKRAINPDDASIRFVSAHSPLREVQRLYDQILQWLNDDPQLKPRDIVVMVPDVDQYAPYIDAVFSSHKATTISGASYHIPWAIADQSLVKENPIIDSFLQLLNLADSRLLVTDIQGWLDVPAIRARFGLDESDLDTLREWMARAQIRWGLNGAQREALGFANFEQNSWRKGLRQLLLGYLLPDGYAAFMDDYPIAAAEGNEGERLGKLMTFIDTLEHWQTQFKQPAPDAYAWIDIVQQLLPDFYQADDQDQVSLQYIRDAINAWQEELNSSGFNGSISITIVRNWFTEHLSQQGGWQRFLAGPVNICSLMPMRSIPFKVVCLLGMNDADYPRRTTPVGFDLMVSGRARRGDRARREDDRYLFLEAVTSAQQYLYVSYRGHEVRENAELQPSVLVAELHDYLCDSFCLKADHDKPHIESRASFSNWLTEELPLQPYNARHFQQTGDQRYVPSYQHLWASVARAGLSSGRGINDANTFTGVGLSNNKQAVLDLPDDVFSQPIQIMDIISALTDPAKFFTRRRLQASLDQYWQEHDTTEPFALDSLEQYQLKTAWLEHAGASVADDMVAFTRRQQALGQLPVNSVGDVLGRTLLQEVASLVDVNALYARNPCEAETLLFTHNNLVLSGELHNVYATNASGINVDAEHYLLQSRVNANRGRHYLQAWLQLVFFSLAKPGAVTHALLLSISKEKNQKTLRVERLDAPTHEFAIKQLEFIVKWYQACWQSPIMHYPNTLWDFLPIYNKAQETSEDDIQSLAEEGLQALLESEFSEFNSAYVSRWLANEVQELPANALAWFEEYGVLMQSIAQHLTNIEQEEKDE